MSKYHIFRQRIEIEQILNNVITYSAIFTKIKFMKIIYILILLNSSLLFGAESFNFSVLHTNDLHSYFEGSGPDTNYTNKTGDGDIVKGHYARLAYLIKKERSEVKNPLLLLDAGDFFAGTLFHAIGPNKKINFFPEAEFFKLMNYDATTFGNHEFDAGDEGLKIMLKKWQELGITTPIISSNSFLQNTTSSLEPFFKSKEMIKDYLIKELSFKDKKLRVGIVGMLGPDGALVSLGTRKDVGFVGFVDENSDKQMSELVKHIKNRVLEIKKKEAVDVVIGLIHGGHPEDIEILEGVPEINLLIAGHTHKVYPKPIKVGKSLLVQAGCFGQYLGKLNLNWDGNKLTVLNEDTIIDVDDNIPADTEMTLAINRYKKELNSFLKETGFSYDSFIYTSKEDLIRKKEASNPLGVMVTSGVREELNLSIKDDHVDVYFTSLGLIRKNISKGVSYQLSDIFKILGIGFDENLNPGPKVVSFYLSKKEVFNLINFLEVYGMMSSKFTPTFSNTLSYNNRWWGIPFLNKLGDLKFNGKSYSEWPELIHIGTSQFVGAYLPKVQSMSYGLLEFIPKDKDGNVLDKPYVHEQKEYVLLAKYLKRRYQN